MCVHSPVLHVYRNASRKPGYSVGQASLGLLVAGSQVSAGGARVQAQTLRGLSWAEPLSCSSGGCFVIADSHGAGDMLTLELVIDFSSQKAGKPCNKGRPWPSSVVTRENLHLVPEDYVSSQSTSFSSRVLACFEAVSWGPLERWKLYSECLSAGTARRLPPPLTDPVFVPSDLAQSSPSTAKHIHSPYCLDSISLTHLRIAF